MLAIPRSTLGSPAIPAATATILTEIFEGWRARGFHTSQECIQVALYSIKFAGCVYARTRDLARDTIDCSTLTSQSHWEGALQQIPFIAETQRLATASMTVSLDTILPGDVVVKYKSLSVSPDGVHNHVALVLGWDRRGDIWLMESTSGTPAGVVRLADFGIDGGIKRFCENPLQSFASPAAVSALRLAPKIPKAARLGARLSAATDSVAERHLGVDVLAVSGEHVYSPASGRLFAEQGGLVWIEIIAGSEGWQIGNMLPNRLSGPVERGEIIGVVGHAHALGSCAIEGEIFLHVAYASKLPRRFAQDPASPMVTNCEYLGPWRYYNWPYLVKLGLIAPPLVAEPSKTRG